jgi:tRNA(fMet)-specific endonuclease VapC
VIKAALRTSGRMIPDNDIWIAASAMQHGLTLATRDQHFQAVDGLQTVSW